MWSISSCARQAPDENRYHDSGKRHENENQGRHTSLSEGCHAHLLQEMIDPQGKCGNGPWCAPEHPRLGTLTHTASSADEGDGQARGRLPSDPSLVRGHPFVYFDEVSPFFGIVVGAFDALSFCIFIWLSQAFVISAFDALDALAACASMHSFIVWLLLPIAWR